ncbi:tubulin delta chain-like [Spea bombifrons]|uniref:tubulin delta chain-like n=1 Tax=Spea bombifrons TaxID=233779 RepID=UPI00234B2D5A|nr:tubulin delta chain-like [Spea bombifrons]
MSLVWLQVGQCGNQVGQEWWELLSGGASEADRYPYVSRNGIANAICVDSEPKVVRRVQRLAKNVSFRDSNLIVGRTGRGNNWAYGYSGVCVPPEESLLDRAMESFRREVERRDCYSGTVLLHSLCGGTGSGLGSRLCEEIRDAYPAGHILSVTVAPHDTGETPLQHYNSLLSLAWLQRYVDGVLLFQNDDVMRQATALSEKKTQTVSGVQPAVSLSAMNSHIASCLAGLLCPVQTLRTQSSVSLGMEPWELIRSLCPMPALKFLHTAQVCRRGTAFWDRVTSSLLQTIPRVSPDGRLHHSLSALAVVRSSQSHSFLASQDAVLGKLKQTYRCVPWNPSPVDCWIDTQNVLDPACRSHSLTVSANHSSAADLMIRVTRRAQAMYSARAYLHWYRRYGGEDEDFTAAFHTLHSVIEEYHQLGQA